MSERVTPVLVTGATGNTGSALVRLLSQRGVPVREIAAALSRATGREITFVDVPPGAFADSLRGMLPEWQLDGLVEDYAHYARGAAETVSSAVAEVTGRRPRDIDAFARDDADAFVAS